MIISTVFAYKWSEINLKLILPHTFSLCYAIALSLHTKTLAISFLFMVGHFLLLLLLCRVCITLMKLRKKLHIILFPFINRKRKVHLLAKHKYKYNNITKTNTTFLAATNQPTNIVNTTISQSTTWNNYSTVHTHKPTHTYESQTRARWLQSEYPYPNTFYY